MVVNFVPGNVGFVLAEPLAATRGTLRFCRTPVEKH